MFERTIRALQDPRTRLNVFAPGCVARSCVYGKVPFQIRRGLDEPEQYEARTLPSLANCLIGIRRVNPEAHRPARAERCSRAGGARSAVNWPGNRARWKSERTQKEKGRSKSNERALRPARELKRYWRILSIGANGLTPPRLERTFRGLCAQGGAYAPPRLQAGGGAPTRVMM